MKITSFGIIISLLISSYAVANDKEIDCLAKNIYYEARGEPETGQFLVGFVTLNRVRSNSWSNSFCSVIAERNQFEWYSTQSLNRKLNNEAFNKAKEIATVVYNSNGTDLSQYGYFFKRTDRESKFFNSLTKISKVGNHSFYKKPAL